MSVALYVTKIEMVDAKTANVSVVIDCDLGRLQLNMTAEFTRGADPGDIIDQVRSRLARFGNELLNSASSICLSIPPQSK
jgi:hypothetical protein